MISYLYSTEYDPPAPIVDISILSEGHVSVTALVDSGADVTLIPVTLLDRVGARYIHTRRLRGVIGAAQTVDLYRVSIEIGSHTIRGIRAVAAESGQETIIGRDVLNQIVVILNGPAEVIEVE